MLSIPQMMPLHLEAFRAALAPLFDRSPPPSQNAIARELGLEPSALSRWLAGGGASYPQVARVAALLGLEPTALWSGPIPRRFQRPAIVGVPRATVPLVREPPRQWGPEITPRDVRGALWAVEQMSLALADIARRAREGAE